MPAIVEYDVTVIRKVRVRSSKGPIVAGDAGERAIFENRKQIEPALTQEPKTIHVMIERVD